jgi:L-fuconolactonase
MIVDTHAHVGTSWFEPVEALIHRMDANGVHKAVLVQHRGMYDNTYLLDCAARHRGRFSVVALVDEASPAAAEHLTQWAERGVSGVRLGSGSPRSLWQAASELGLTVSYRQDIAEFASGRFNDLVAGLPKPVPVVVEHFAGGVAGMEEPYEEFADALKIAELPNVYVKLGGLGEISHRPSTLGPDFRLDFTPPFVEMLLEAFGPNRTMWGSDYPPVGNREGYRHALHGIMDHPSLNDPQDRNWVLGRTASNVFRFL